MNSPPFLRDPFRLFFPLGWLAGLMGVALWLPLAWDNSAYYPVQAHRLTMVGGFLLAFVTGFLTTAIPRFTSTWYLRGWELFLLCVSQLGALLFALLPIPLAHYGFFFLTITGLILVAVRRFLQRSENPPFTFVFVAAGLLLWMVASLALFLHSCDLLVTVLIEPARAIYAHGALLCLVIGVGGRLIPGILEWTNIVAEQRSRYENAESYEAEIPFTLWFALAVFLSSYVVEGLTDPRVLWFVRGGVLLYVAVRYWKLHRPPRKRTGFTWGIWISCWSFVLGTLVPVVWPSGGIHGVHMVFIGGFSLLTILVATRVTLAHGTRGKGLESSSRILQLFIGLFVLSTLTRVTAVIWPRVYLSHLGYAALLWIVGIVLWALIVIPRMVGDFEVSQHEN